MPCEGLIPNFTDNTFYLRKFWKILSRTLLVLLLLIVLLYALLHLIPVQNWLVKKVTDNLSEKLHAKISIRHIDFDFFDKLELKGLYVEDQYKDTLLYAGSASIKITDWFFLKDKVTLHYVALEDAQVNLSRSKDTVWNHQFLVDYFGGSKESKDTSGGIDLKLEELKLKNISIRQIDGWKGKDMLVSLKSLDLVADTFDLKKQIISISKLDIDTPVFTQRDYTGERDRLGIIPPKKPKDTTKTQPGGLAISVMNLHITNGTFNNEAETERGIYPGQFDGSHISFTGINADMKNLHFENDSLSTNITLATKERSGFEVKKLAAKMKFTSEIMEFNDLELITNKSRLGNYYSMRYEDFDEDMGHFLHNIKLRGNFVNSELHTDDLAFFAPELKTWKRVFNFSGTAKGTIDNLAATKMIIKSGNTTVDGDITMNGLPDIETTFIDFTSRQLQTNYDDLAVLVPSLKEVNSPKLNRLGNISYKGNFTGFINDFVAFGTINTNLGTVTGDLNLKLPDNKHAVYSGSVATQGFRLGQFLDDTKIGAITFNGKVNGSGFSFKNLDAKFDGNVRSVEYDGYTYQNLTLKGGFKKKLFNGFASADDPNLKVEKLTGTIDFNGKVPVFNFDAQLNKADFKNLGLTKDDFRLKGHFILNFTGDNIDNFLGTAEVKDANLLHNGQPLSFDYMVLKSDEVDGKKYLSLQSNELDASVAGNFKIQELPNAFQVFLSRYYPAYIKAPSKNITNQDFSFEIKTKNIDEYIQLVDKKLKGFNNSTISGNLRLQSNELNITADVPQFSYDGKEFNNVFVEGKGNRDSLAANVNVDDIAISDSMHLPHTNLIFTSSNNVSDVSLKTSASQTLSEASINARVTTLADAVNIHFFPSSLIINDNKWELEKDGEITIGKSLISASDVKFVQGEQEIKISTQDASIGESNDVIVDLKKVHIDEWAALGLKKPELQGEASGTIKIEDPFGKPFIDYDLMTDKFMFGNDSFGLVKIKGTYNVGNGVLSPEVISENKDNQLNITGTINLKDSNGVKTSLLVKSEKLQLSFLNAFLGDLFSNIQGTANTTGLAFNSDGTNSVITGTANINEGSLVVNYTQCKYNFKNESIVFNPNEIDFGEIKLKDTLNNDATLSGRLYHRFFNDTEFDNISLKSDRFLVLNTTKKDNPVFYGKVVGKIDKFNITGNQDNILIDIKGEPSVKDSSHVYIVSGNSIEKEDIDYIDFIQFGTEMESKYKSKSSANVLVDMELKANPSCKVDVILDEATGDIIKGEGNGLLKIRVGNKEDMTMNGRYDITKGEYTFNFQTFLKKYFTVNSGSSIVWDGDPFAAKINITAEYLATNVDFRALSSGSTSGTGSFNQKSNLRILANLTNTLMKPDIDFDLKLPPGSPITDFLVLKRLEQFKLDKNELNKQITSLLLFNSFIGAEQSFVSASGGFSVLSNTIGGVVSGAISGFFNNLLQKYVKNLTFNFDLNSSLDLQQNVEKLQTAARSNFVYTLLNGRLIISAGLNIDYNNPYANINRNSNLLITPDVTVEWILTKSGRLRVVGFNRTNYDLVGQRNRTGVSLSYRRDFNKLAKAFKFLFFEFSSKKKKEKIEKGN